MVKKVLATSDPEAQAQGSVKTIADIADAMDDPDRPLTDEEARTVTADALANIGDGVNALATAIAPIGGFFNDLRAMLPMLVADLRAMLPMLVAAAKNRKG